MFGAYVRFKCNYAALSKSSVNQQQHGSKVLLIRPPSGSTQGGLNIESVEIAKPKYKEM